MDNQQPLPPSNLPGATTQAAETERPPSVQLLGLTYDQRGIIRALASEKAQQVLSFRFNEPEDDHLRLRQHSYCVGGMEVLYSLLEYDELAVQDFESKLREQTSPSSELQSDF